MEIQKIVHMNGGDGELSYYNNSSHQRHLILRSRAVLEESIAQVTEKFCTECVKIADMGCSSGPNTLLPLWLMIETIDSTCNRLSKTPPMLQVFLNDLPGTDFNTIFSCLVPNFQEKMEKEKGRKAETCLIGAMPGSFYGRLFPNNSLHFVHSSCALHWCSQVPKKLVTENGIQLNKGRIYADIRSPEIVHEIYLDQFRKDFTVFLESRSEELISMGGMLLSILVQGTQNPHSHFQIWELFRLSLQDMVNEGIITELLLDSFNVPVYGPPLEEVRKVIEKVGWFNIKRVEEIEIELGVIYEEGKREAVSVDDKGKYLAKILRAAIESMVAYHFGDAIIEDLFSRFSSKASAYFEKGICSNTYLVISLTKK